MIYWLGIGLFSILRNGNGIWQLMCLEMGNANNYHLFECEIGLFVRKDGLFSSLMQKVADN